MLKQEVMELFGMTEAQANKAIKQAIEYTSIKESIMNQIAWIKADE